MIVLAVVVGLALVTLVVGVCYLLAYCSSYHIPVTGRSRGGVSEGGGDVNWLWCYLVVYWW